MAESPVWKRPSEVMKIHRRRKSVSQRRITTDADKRTSLIYKSPSKTKKRTNPFLCNSDQPSKRQNVYSSSQENLSKPSTGSRDHQLFDMLDTVDQSGTGVKGDSHETLSQQSDVERVSSPPVVSPPRALSESHHGNRQQKTQAADIHKEPDETTPCGYLPVDWSLKSKLRVVSSRPLNWCTQLRSSDEAAGLTDFVRDHSSQIESIADQKKMFQQSCMYWIHPNLPWARLFPRIIDDTKQSISFVPLLNDIVQKSLQTDWEQSFTSVYYQLRTGLCPYFYLCTHQFTVMFHREDGGGGGAQPTTRAMITPTTRGFRELLSNEGISFTLPVGGPQQSPGKEADAKQPPQQSRSQSSDADMDEKRDQDAGKDGDEEGDEDLLETDDAASGWLESMGLDKKEFPSLDPRKVKLQREGYRVIDHRPESLVLVGGADVQALFNFLLNCRACTAQSGAQAGIPPTILAPTAFRGATLKSHKVKHTAVKQSDRDGNVSHAHIVEVTGPLMPRHCQSLVSLFHRTQAADFGTVYNTHDPTLPFNILPSVVKSQKCKDSIVPSVVKSHKCRNCDKRRRRNSSDDHKLGSSLDKLETNKHRSSLGSSNSSGLSSCSQSDGGEWGEGIGDRLGDAGDTGEVCECDEGTRGETEGALFRDVPLADNRLCAIKEFVCTKEGFTFTS